MIPVGDRFGTWSGSATLGFGTPNFGNFLAINVSRSGRFLDTPEFLPIHDIGNNGSIFDRFDWQPGPQDIFHLDLFTARNWFQVPNSYDQLTQDQKQRVMSWSIAPGYQHTFNAHTLLTVNPFVRRDQLNYYPSRDPFDDTPVTASQNRVLMNYGVKADLAYTPRTSRYQDRDPNPANQAAREFPVRHHQSRTTIRCAWIAREIRCCCPASPIRTIAGLRNPATVPNPEPVAGNRSL